MAKETTCETKNFDETDKEDVVRHRLKDIITKVVVKERTSIEKRSELELLISMLYTFVTSLKETKYQSVFMMMKYLEVIGKHGEWIFLEPVCFYERVCDPYYESKELIKKPFDRKIIEMAATVLYRYYCRYCLGEQSAEEDTRVASVYADLLTLSEACGQYKEMPRRFPLRIKEFLDEYVVGQEEAKRVVAMQLYRYLSYGDRSPILLIGPSGSGKNFLIDTLEECPLLTDVFFYRYDITQMTENGFSGGDNTIDFAKRFGTLKKNKKKALIYIDEIDKIMMPSFDAHGENVHAVVQFQIMNMLAGERIGGVDFKEVQFILGGAFAQLYDMEKKQNRPVGFAREREENSMFQEASLRYNLLDLGTTHEFLGRIPILVRLKRHTPDELRQIMMHPVGYLKKKKSQFQQLGLRLEIEDAAFDKIIEYVYEENLGARAIANILEHLIGTSDFQMLETGDDMMIITEEAVTNDAPPIFKKTGKSTRKRKRS